MIRLDGEITGLQLTMGATKSGRAIEAEKVRNKGGRYYTLEDVKRHLGLDGLSYPALRANKRNRNRI